eukprot:2599517-Alexandrium_andersonii.AAC.1
MRVDAPLPGCAPVPPPSPRWDRVKVSAAISEGCWWVVLGACRARPPSCEGQVRCPLSCASFRSSARLSP